MKTSCYSNTPPSEPGAIAKRCCEAQIAISLKVPQKYRRRYSLLAPTPELLKAYKSGSPECQPIERYYTHEFFDQLFELNARAVWYELHRLVDGHEPILLCYEPPGEFCHRRLVAKWFEHELGEVVEELAVNQGGLR